MGALAMEDALQWSPPGLPNLPPQGRCNAMPTTEPESFSALLKEQLAEMEATPDQPATDEAAPATGDGLPADESAEEPAPDQPEEQSNEESDEEQSDEEESGEEEIIQNPAAMLKAHRGLKEKYRKRGERLQELEEQLKAVTEEVTPLLLPPTVENPLSAVRTKAELAQAANYWKAELEWCAENPDGGLHGANEAEVDAQWVKERRQLATNILTKHLEERRQYVDDFAGNLRSAMDKYAFFAPNNALYAEFDAFATQVIQQSPALSQNAQWPSLMARAFTMGLVESGRYAATPGEDGKMKLVALKTGKPGVTVPRTAQGAPARPANSMKGTTPPARKVTGDEALEEALAKNDPAAAIAAWVKSNHS